MAGTYSFHVVRRETELSALGEALYADAHNRADFLRLNDSAVANGDGHLRAGQVVFLPESSCYSHESEIMETVREINHIASNPEHIRLQQRSGAVKLLFNYGNVANVLRFGGAAVIGIDATLTMDTIQEACAAGGTLECARTRAVETGGFAGRTLGGVGGGSWAAYAGCNLVFGKVSGGTSLPWCGLIGAPLSGFASSVVLGNFGERVGNWWHEARHPIRYEP